MTDEFTLKQVSKRIWHLHFSNNYDLTMHFFRYQEYYESPDLKECNVQFVDLMENYSKKFGKGLFTYPKDWAGFNMPGTVIFNRHNAGISDHNRYDQMMHSIAKYIRAKELTENFYIIGTSEEDEWKNITFNHELAHGLFFTDPIYKQAMTQLVNELPEKIRTQIFKQLAKWGYDESFYHDETQAYMATGLQDGLDVKSVKTHKIKFEKIFNQNSRGLRKVPEKDFYSTKTVKKKKKTKK